MAGRAVTAREVSNECLRPAVQVPTSRSFLVIESKLCMERVYGSIRQLVAAGTTILLVEQDLDRALAVASRVICMLQGRIVAQGAVGELTRQQIVDADFGPREAQSH